MLGILTICLRVFFRNVSILNEMPIPGQAPSRTCNYSVHWNANFLADIDFIRIFNNFTVGLKNTCIS